MKHKTARRIPPLTEEMQAASSAYLLARVCAEALKPIAREIERALLAEMPVHYNPKWADMSRRRGGEILEGRITDPELLYLGTDEEVAAYFEVLDQRKQERWPDPARPKGHCPYLVADHLRIQAENVMIDAAVSLHGHTDLTHECVHGEQRRQLIDLILGLVINHPHFKAPEMPAAT